MDGALWGLAAIAVAGTAAGYRAFDRLFEAHAPTFRTLSHDKRMYAVSNATKAAALLLYTPMAALSLKRALWDDWWQTSAIHALAVLYATPDGVSLVLVRRMARTTVAHHVLVLVFAALIVAQDMDVGLWRRGVVVYACCSTFAYPVNWLLATRFFRPSRLLRKATAALYVGLLAANWSWQVGHVLRLPAQIGGLYAASFAAIVYDDLVLCRWLLRAPA